MIPYVQSPRGEYNIDGKVRELLEDDYSGWNEQKVRAIFNQVEATHILAILISPSRRDALTWQFTKMGMYSVKTGYEEWIKRGGLAYNNGDGEAGLRWRWVWQLDSIPKIKVFCWQLLHDILSSRINLIGRFIDVDPFCVRCGTELETSEHALQDCIWVREF